jgi:hypothetical protein
LPESTDNTTDNKAMDIDDGLAAGARQEGYGKAG